MVLENKTRGQILSIRGQALAVRGQASIEYLILVGTSLIIIAVLSAYAFTSFSDTISTNELRTSSEKIESAINYVYALGEGNSVVVQIKLPANVTKFGGATVANKSFVTETNFNGSLAQNITEVDTNVSGSICPPNCEGQFDIEVKNNFGSVSLNVV